MKRSSLSSEQTPQQERRWRMLTAVAAAMCGYAVTCAVASSFRDGGWQASQCALFVALLCWGLAAEGFLRYLAAMFDDDP